MLNSECLNTGAEVLEGGERPCSVRCVTQHRRCITLPRFSTTFCGNASCSCAVFLLGVILVIFHYNRLKYCCCCCWCHWCCFCLLSCAVLCCAVQSCPVPTKQAKSFPAPGSCPSDPPPTCLPPASPLCLTGRPSTCRQTIERKNRVVASSLAGDAVELSARLKRRWELFVALPPNSGGSWQPSSVLGAPRSYIGVYRELGGGRVSRGRSPESSVQCFGWSPSTTRMLFGQHRTGSPPVPPNS